MIKNKESFAVLLIEFYSKYLIGSTDSVRILAKIQHKYNKEYEIMKKVDNLNDNYDLLYEIEKLNILSILEMETLLLIIYKGQYINRQLNKLFELTITQKKELANTIIEFNNYSDEKLNEIININKK